jgi:hypothetical protein
VNQKQTQNQKNPENNGYSCNGYTINENWFKINEKKAFALKIRLFDKFIQIYMMYI